MSPTRRDIFKRTAATVAAASIAGVPSVPVVAHQHRPTLEIDPVHLVWHASCSVEQYSGAYLVNELSMNVTPQGVSFVVTDGAPLSERRTIESTDPAIIGFLSEVAMVMQEMQYKFRPCPLTKDQWKQVAAKQLAGERLSEMAL